ncbi:MAG: hypothetical protein HFE43_07225 [Oscillospiraceae bacterium]|nr:hypothetical protein [Oscillospiraceae bacterium]
MGRNKLTISRELRRSTGKGEYCPSSAEAQYHKTA